MCWCVWETERVRVCRVQVRPGLRVSHKKQPETLRSAVCRTVIRTTGAVGNANDLAANARLVQLEDPAISTHVIARYLHSASLASYNPWPYYPVVACGAPGPTATPYFRLLLTTACYSGLLRTPQMVRPRVCSSCVPLCTPVHPDLFANVIDYSFIIDSLNRASKPYLMYTLPVTFLSESAAIHARRHRGSIRWRRFAGCI